MGLLSGCLKHISYWHTQKSPMATLRANQIMQLLFHLWNTVSVMSSKFDPGGRDIVRQLFFDSHCIMSVGFVPEMRAQQACGAPGVGREARFHQEARLIQRFWKSKSRNLQLSSPKSKFNDRGMQPWVHVRILKTTISLLPQVSIRISSQQEFMLNHVPALLKLLGLMLTSNWVSSCSSRERG